MVNTIPGRLWGPPVPIIVHLFRSWNQQTTSTACDVANQSMIVRLIEARMAAMRSWGGNIHKGIYKVVVVVVVVFFFFFSAKV